MQALVYSEAKGLQFREDYPKPKPEPDEALVKVTRAGICSTDLEILKGYVPGYNNVLGHEFVGQIVECPSNTNRVGERVVGEINCRPTDYAHEDPIFERNHAPGRTVLGIIGRDGTLAEYLTLPTKNLLPVPPDISDKEACFTEPLAAACRIVEQEVISSGQHVAVIGDGKLGLLVAQLLAVRHKGLESLVHFGRHTKKLSLVTGTEQVLVEENTQTAYANGFDVVIEASGSSRGISLATALCRPLGTIVLKSTCSAVNDSNMPKWSDIANDIVVNEKRLIGSRCGPFESALAALKEPAVKKLLDGMVCGEFPLTDGVAAIEAAQAKGALKVQVVM